MIKYPLKLKIIFKSFADLNYIVFKEGNEISYKVIEDDSIKGTRYRTSAKIEEKVLFEILYEILYELDLSPADLAKTVTSIHSEILLQGGHDFIFSEIKESVFSWAHTRGS